MLPNNIISYFKVIIIMELLIQYFKMNVFIIVTIQ